MVSERQKTGRCADGSKPCPRLWMLLLTLLLAPAGCVDPIPANTITGPAPRDLQGVVKNACTQEPIAGAVVVAQKSENQDKGVLANTDAAGKFLLPDLGQGSWDIQISSKSFRTSQQVVVISESAPAELDIFLNPDVGTTPTSAVVDVLFVVDNSDSMKEEQQNLTDSFPQLLNGLFAAGISLDLHIGVVSTDLDIGYIISSCNGGDGGRLQHEPRILGCDAPSDPWISYSAGTTNLPDSSASAVDQISEAFSCIATLGINGCGFEQPLEAMRTALDPALNVNPGFLRDNSTLLVVIISDEDDCSAEHQSLFDPSDNEATSSLGPLSSFRCFEFGAVCDESDLRAAGSKHNCHPGQQWLYDIEEYHTFLDQLRPAGNIYLGVIAGPTSEAIEVNSKLAVEPSCQSEQGSAVPALRLSALVDALSPNSSFDVLCNANLGPVLQALASRVVNTALLQACP